MERKCPHKDEGFFLIRMIYILRPMFNRHFILSISIFFFVLSANLYAQSSSDLLEERLTQAREKKDFMELAETYLAIGDFEEENYRNYEKAFESYTRSMEYFNLVQDSNKVFLVKQKLANHFRLTGQLKEALDHYNEVIDYLKKTDQKQKLANAYLDVAKLYGDINDLEPQGRFLDSIQNIKLIESDTLFTVLFNFEKIRYYQSISDINTAKKLSQQTLELCKNLNYDFYTGKAYYYLGALNADSNTKESLIYLNNGYNFIKNRSLEPLKLNLLKELSETNLKNKNYKQAYEYSKMYSKLNDSILNGERVVAINNLTVKYETRQKNKDIELLEKQTQLAQSVNAQQRRALYVLGGGLGLLALGIYFIIKFFRQQIRATRIINMQRDKLDKQKIKDLENDVKISSMQSVIEGQELERERIAKDLHDSLGGLLSAIKLQFEKVRSDSDFKIEGFDNAQGLLDTAVDEVRSISRNLQPGSLNDMGLVAAINDLINRYTGGAYPDIDFQNYNIPRDLDNMFATSIYRIIQELLNNAIKYAKASEIIIQLNKEDDEIIISVEDDGIGFNPNSFDKGMGLENVQSRVKYLKGDLQIDSQENVGTSYLIHVKMDNA